MATLTIIGGANGSATKQVGDILEKCTGVMLFVDVAIECSAHVGIIKTEISENLDKRGREQRKKAIEEFEDVTL